MEKIKFVKDVKDASQACVLNDGRIFATIVEEDECSYFLCWDTHFSLETGEIYKFNKQGDYPADATTLQEIIEVQHSGKIVEPYEEFNYHKDVYPKDVVLNANLYRRIQAYFKNHYNRRVSIKAIEYCLVNWKNDYKSGYRDEKNGYHLFSPCGCNSLRLSMTTLVDSCAYWQKTYFA
jgi:hypothetical protein